MAGISKQDLLEVLQDSNADEGQTPNSTAAAMAGQKEGYRDSWKELYRVLITSLRHSSLQFQALSFEALTLGLWGLSTAHAALRDDIVGQQTGVNDRGIIKELIYFGEWARAFEAGKTVTELAAALYIQESDVVVYQPDSQPMLPAHLLALDHTHRQLLLVVRGTTQLADALTDLVAHTTTLGPGQVHSGMLDCARAIVQLRLPAVEEQLKQYPGYRIHCIGHSLGGGVAALAAYLFRHTPELRSSLAASGCSGVVATGFGTPPVMTQELAESVSSYTRTLVHNHDLVPRTCVASLAVLRQELEQQKEAAFANNTTMSWLRDSGAFEGGKTLLAGAVTYAVANTSATKAAGVVTRSAGMQRFVAAGLQVGASLLASKMKELHTDAMREPVGAKATFATAAASKISSSNTAVTAAAATTTAAQTSSSSSDTPSTVAIGAAQAGATQPPTHAGAASSRWGSFASLKQAAAAATAAAASKLQQQQHYSVPARDAAAAHYMTEQLQQQQQQQLNQQAVGNVVACMDVGQQQQQQQQQQQKAEEDQAAGVMLRCPGQLFYLKRTGEDADAKYELICKEHGAAAAAGSAAAAGGGSSPCFGRILVNRSMLRDHYLSHYITGLHKLGLQLLEDM